MRRFLRFRLKTLFIVMTVLIVVLGNWMYRVRQQKLAVEAIEQAGGRVSYEYQVEAAANRRASIRYVMQQNAPMAWKVVEINKIEAEDMSPGPAWLKNLVGVHYFVKPESVTFRSGERATPEAMGRLSDLAGVRRLWISERLLPPEVLRNLRPPPGLEEFHLEPTPRVREKMTSHSYKACRGFAS